MLLAIISFSQTVCTRVFSSAVSNSHYLPCVHTVSPVSPFILWQRFSFPVSWCFWLVCFCVFPDFLIKLPFGLELSSFWVSLPVHVLRLHLGSTLHFNTSNVYIDCEQTFQSRKNNSGKCFDFILPNIIREDDNDTRVSSDFRSRIIFTIILNPVRTLSGCCQNSFWLLSSTLTLSGL